MNKEAEAEDAALFRAAVGIVAPLPDQNRINPQKPPRKPLLRIAAPPAAIPDTLSNFYAENAPDEFLHNGHGKYAIPVNRICHARFPLPIVPPRYALPRKRERERIPPPQSSPASGRGGEREEQFSIPESLHEFRVDGLSRMTLRKLRRGHWPVEDSLDLHGSHIDTARRLLQEFLHEASQRGWRCVLVIHGKGMNSQCGEGVLRKLTRHWLTQRTEVLAYCDAPPGEGGSGAVLILLKATAPSDK